MDTPQVCPICGKPVVSEAPQGLCPECLMKSGFGTKAGNEPGPGKSAFVPPSVEQMATLFPQLEIIELLGQGGMGAVYKARQPRLNRFVALKILSPEKQNDPQFAERFEREARALAWLNHPNIVTVYDFGETQGNYYLLMEFVDGMTLRRLLQARRLASAEALAIVPQICEALQYAHDQGIIHRDLKPENILLDKKGQVKIADFGIAKLLDQEPQSISLTGAADVVGTPHYMAPEQIEKPQTVDHRADIYSLGVVFYEMLTGELPLGNFQPPSQKVQIDVRFDEVVLHALEKEPERRYQEASQVKTAVETIASTTAATADAEMLTREILERDYTLDIGSCLRRGWALVRSDFWPVVGVTALILLLRIAALPTLIGIVVSGPLMGGLCLYFLKKIRGEQAGAGTAFSGFSIAFLPLFLASFVKAVLTIAGFCCLLLPGIYLTVAWTFTLVLVIDKRLGFWTAMGLSRKTISKHWWKFFGFSIVLSLIKLAGMLVFVVGSLVTAPIALAALMYAYEDIFGARKEPADIPSPVPAVAATAPSTRQPNRFRGWLIVVVLALIVITIGIVLVLIRPATVATPPLIQTPEYAAARQSMPAIAETDLGSSNAFWNLLNEDQRDMAQRTDRQFRNFFDTRTFTGWSDKERAHLETHLVDTLEGPQTREYYQAINTLAALHSTNALPALREIAFDRRNKDNRDRWMAVRALGIIGDKTAVPELIHLIYHNNSNVRSWAQISLVRLTGQNFGKDWQTWGKWWNSQDGQPPFNPEIIHWLSSSHAESDGAAESLAESDRKPSKSSQGKSSPIINDVFWQNLDRKNYERYRKGLRQAPHVLVVRHTHYNLNELSHTGIGIHHGWIDGKMANLCVSFSELVSYAYSQQAAWDPHLVVRTEFPQEYVGQFTNQFDVIDTLRVRPVERLQAEIKQQLKQQFGLSWHREIRDTEVLSIKVKDPQLLESKISHDFAGSRSMPELAGDWENYFGKPVLDETGLTNRYDRKMELIPAAYIPHRTKDLEVNNAFLAFYGLELVPTNQPMEWLAMEREKK
jgi:tRNA A-37 threonylcarbamoyl transferase component Bud32